MMTSESTSLAAEIEAPDLCHHLPPGCWQDDAYGKLFSLYGGAIHAAGAVKLRKAQSRHTTSHGWNWNVREVSRSRPVSCSLRTPGTISTFSTRQDTTISAKTPTGTPAAADTAVMLIDSGKGVEPQTIKLFQVCRMRKIPIITFMNKLDRAGRDPST